MMNCEKIQILLPEFARDELASVLTGQVETHLMQCQACRLEFEGELELMVGLGGLPMVACPEQVTTAIFDEIDQEKQQARWSKPWLLGTSTLVAASLALFLLFPQSPVPVSESDYTRAEIRNATRDAHYALAKVAAVINHNESNAFEQVFGQEIPDAVGGSLRLLTKNLQGEV